MLTFRWPKGVLPKDLLAIRYKDMGLIRAPLLKVIDDWSEEQWVLVSGAEIRLALRFKEVDYQVKVCQPENHDQIILVGERVLIAFEESIDEKVLSTAEASLDKGDRWLMLSWNRLVGKGASFSDKGLVEQED